MGMNMKRDSTSSFWTAGLGLAVLSVNLGTAFAQENRWPTLERPATSTMLEKQADQSDDAAQRERATENHNYPTSTRTATANGPTPPNSQTASGTAANRPATGASPDKQAAETQKKQEDLKKKIATAHKGVYYLNDFSYVIDPAYRGRQLGDGLKQNKLFRDGFYDIGGEYRMRQHHENNMRGAGGVTGVDDDFLLRRTRLYGNFQFTKNFRFFGEMIDAQSDFENRPPRSIEINDVDMLNLFADLQMWSDGDRSVLFRAGRQELLLGAQRLISPLDWSNTRRTFDGYRVTAKSKILSMDGFYTNPVLVDRTRFDSPDLQQEFMGLYSSYTGFRDEVMDFYVLRYNNASGANDFDFNTFGTRINGTHGVHLYDIEVMYQSGRNTDGSAHDASSYTAGLGQKLNSRSDWNPTIWQYFDWASGNDSRGAGNGFHHLFPLGHRYNGFMDLFGRRNLGDVNTQLTFTPSKKLTMLLWYHYFYLANKNDTPYNLAMVPINPAGVPASRDLGHELDILGTVAISPRQQLLLGYSHFWAGKYFASTAGVASRKDADFLYTQWALAF